MRATDLAVCHPGPTGVTRSVQPDGAAMASRRRETGARERGYHGSEPANQSPAGPGGRPRPQEPSPQTSGGALVRR